MSQNIPESFEVLSHFIVRFIKACVQAPHSEKFAKEYLNMLDEVVTNEDRLRSVLELIGKDIFAMLTKMSEGSENSKSVTLDFEEGYSPEIHESMLADWLVAISEDDPEEFYGLINLLVDEGTATVTLFVMLLMTFYTNFIQKFA